MARSKTAALSNRIEHARDDSRHRVSLEARLGVAAGVTKNDPLQLWLGEAGPFAARLCWVKRGSLGVEFEEALDEALVSRLAQAAAEPNVVAIRRPRAG